MIFLYHNIQLCKRQFKFIASANWWCILSWHELRNRHTYISFPWKNKVLSVEKNGIQLWKCLSQDWVILQKCTAKHKAKTHNCSQIEPSPSFWGQLSFCQHTFNTGSFSKCTSFVQAQKHHKCKDTAWISALLSK